MLKKIKPTLRTIHLIAALTLGLYLTALCVSGSILVFKKELTHWLHPTWYTVQPTGERLAVSEILSQYKAAHPKARIAYIQLPQHADSTMQLWDGQIGWGQQRIFINPYSGAVVASHLYVSTWLNWLEYLHIALFVGGPDGTGVKTNAWLGIASVILLLTGLILWWPKNARQLKARLKIKWRASWPRVNWDIHHAVGIWALPALLFLCLSGSAIVFPGPIKAVANWIIPAPLTAPKVQAPATITDEHATGQVAPSAKAKSVASDKKHSASLSIDDLLARAVAAVPGSKPVMLMLLGDQYPLYVFMHPTSNPDDLWWMEAAVDRKTGAIVHIHRSSDSAGDTAAAMLFPLHAGSIGGLPLKIAWFVIGLLPVGLLVTGFLMWWKRSGPGWKRRLFQS